MPQMFVLETRCQRATRLPSLTQIEMKMSRALLATVVAAATTREVLYEYVCVCACAPEIC